MISDQSRVERVFSQSLPLYTSALRLVHSSFSLPTSSLDWITGLKCLARTRAWLVRNLVLIFKACAAVSCRWSCCPAVLSGAKIANAISDDRMWLCVCSCFLILSSLSTAHPTINDSFLSTACATQCVQLITSSSESYVSQSLGLPLSFLFHFSRNFLSLFFSYSGLDLRAAFGGGGLSPRKRKSDI